MGRLSLGSNKKNSWEPHQIGAFASQRLLTLSDLGYSVKCSTYFFFFAFGAVLTVFFTALFGLGGTSTTSGTIAVVKT